MEGTLPRDAVLLPLFRGRLLVSREHAVFCRIPFQETGSVCEVLDNLKPLSILSWRLHKDLERHGFFGPPRPPRKVAPTVQIQLTNECPLSCRYCCTNSGRPRSNEISLEQVLQAVLQIPDALGPETRVALLGGEPFLVPWAVELAEKIAETGLHLTIFSSGILLAEDRLAESVARLTRRGISLRVSLAGPTASTCDTLSEGSRFEATLAGLHRLASFGGAATVDLMLVPETVDCVARELPALRKRLPENTPLTLGLLYLGGRETGHHVFRERSERDIALDHITFGAGESITIQQPGPLAWRRDGCSCAMGKHLHIRSDGTLFTCFRMEEPVGALATDGFASTARRVRAHPHRASDLPLCRECPLVTLCGAGCRSENALYTGDPDQPPCGSWRVRVLSELLAEDRIEALEWPVAFLLGEARKRGIDAPTELVQQGRSRHLADDRLNGHDEYLVERSS